MNISEDAHEIRNGLEPIGSGELSQRESAMSAEIRRLRAERDALRQALQQEPQTDVEPRPQAYVEDDGRERGDQSGSNPPASATRPRGRRIRLAIATVFAIVLAVAGLKLWNYLSSYESTDDAQIDGHINPISSRIDGTISRVYVNDTDIVKQGQPLADIDPRDYQVAVEQARANLATAQAQVEQAIGNYNADLAKIEQAEAANVKAQNDAARYRALLAQNVVSRAEYDQYISAAKVNAGEVESDRATAEADRKKIVSQRAMVKASQAALDQALLNLGYTHIVAPLSGVVGKKTVEVGQRVQPGQDLLAIVPLNDIWVTANFKETQLREMRPGQRVTIHVDALGRDYNGYVEGLGGASGEIYSVLPPENATGNYVKVVQRFPVRIRFDPGQDPGHRLRPGMSVEPKVWIR